MPLKTVQQLSALQQHPANIRNICILAHVDHGKTTLADALVASNGIISQRMAGKMRYMDSREDEQVRGITMKSSAISLFYEKGGEQFLVNLIDSPGHVDFSSEVSTAVRLCDGAVILVDVVEGVCPQTHAVLRQAWLENIRPVLVLNKFDRLITELKMSPLEAFLHLQQILVEVNLLTNQLFTSEAMERMSAQTDVQSEHTDRQIAGTSFFSSALDGWGFTISMFAHLYATKLGISQAVLQKTLWGDFYINSKTKRVMKGAQSKGKTPLFVQLVLDNIWAVYDAIIEKRDKAMTEKIIKSLGLKIAPRDMRHSDPRVQLNAVISQWLPVSEAVLSVVIEQLPSPLQMSEERVEKLMCSQNRQFDSFPSQTRQLKTDFVACSASEEAPVIVYVSKMFPVECKSLPQYRQRSLTEQELQARAQAARQRYAESLAQAAGTESGKAPDTTNGEKMKEGETSGETIQPLEANNVNGHTEGKVDDPGPQKGHVFIAFARIFSGMVQRGQRLYVLGPKHDPAKALLQDSGVNGENIPESVRNLGSGQHITSFVVNDLYMFMGRELEQLHSVPAGNVLGIGGLEDHILKSGTVSSTVACPAFTNMYFDASPILRVAVEPASPGDMSRLVEGLRLLNQADPCVRVLVQETGEHVIVTAGEVHLERCVDDLRERYAKVEVNVSKPIVPFRETIIPRPRVDRVNEAIQDQNVVLSSGRLKEFEDDDEVLEEGVVEIYTPNHKCVVRIRAVPLPAGVTDCILRHQEVIKTLQAMAADRAGQTCDLQTGFQVRETAREELTTLHSELQQAFKAAGPQWAEAVDHIWAFGPRHNGPNILLNRVPDYNRQSVWGAVEAEDNSSRAQQPAGEIRQNDSSIMAGFQMATQAGPLCEEPLHGVCFVIERWENVDSKTSAAQLAKDTKNLSLRTDSASNKVSDVSKKRSEKSKDTSANGGLQDSDDSSNVKDVFGPMSGQLMSVVKDGCRKAFQTMPQRLMVAMYRCTIQATTDVLGRLYAVIGKRHGRVISEELREGTQMFNILVEFPVVESFGLTDEMRKRTSGLASPQFRFSHWEVLDLDPFWVPSTEEEYMHYGEKADIENRARAYMNEVRRRKGLKVDEKIVEFAEKQRTLTRNK
ncbi:hypothetical protein BaRGS_00037651 [Batillaria attramentaria]|uniref:Ribosome assembly protein 1 n=1 Tax=Batillaria attramentaria TaxID=370345 RepID=A0ABD0J883_9CAEN